MWKGSAEHERANKVSQRSAQTFFMIVGSNFHPHRIDARQKKASRHSYKEKRRSVGCP